jgi:hypothetical protein
LPPPVTIDNAKREEEGQQPDAPAATDKIGTTRCHSSALRYTRAPFAVIMGKIRPILGSGLCGASLKFLVPDAAATRHVAATALSQRITILPALPHVNLAAY